MEHPRPSPDATPAPEPVDEVVRLATLSHELSNLLDGSLRCVSMARTDIITSLSEAGALERASRRLAIVSQALERMAGLIDGAMRDASRAIEHTGGPIAAIPLGESMRHAVAVLSPRAAAAHVLIDLVIDPDAESIPTGPLYTPILNGLRNAVDAVAGTKRPGAVQIRVNRWESPEGPAVRLTIRDSGPGLPRGFSLLNARSAPRPGGMGIGLALSSTIIHHLGGDLRLTNARDGSPGAVLEFWCPIATLVPSGEGATA